jgi:predicted nucleotidyltransferase
MGGSLSAAQIQTSVRLLCAAFPMAEAIYVFGSAASGQLDTTGTHSDVDISVLLPHQEAKAAGSLALSEARFRLEEALGRTVDLLNARTAPIVLQKEIIGGGICVFAADSSRIEEYEMLVLSLYGKLNEERRGILEEFFASGRAYPV